MDDAGCEVSLVWQDFSVESGEDVMTKLLKALMCVIVVSMFAGCVSMSSSIPTAYVPLEDVKTSATYDVIGPAKGTSSGGFLFGFIPVGVEQKMGTIGGGSMQEMRFYTPVQRAAIYAAIESVPTADAMIAPRFDTVTKNYIIYAEQTVTVKGKAIRYNASGK